MTLRSSTVLAGASAASAVINVPAGAAADDIAVVGLYLESAAVVTPASGFTNKVSLATSPTTQGRLDVFWKRLTGADTGTYTFSWTGAVWTAAECGLWSGRILTGDPFDGTGTAESGTGVTTLNVSATPVSSGGDALGFWTNFSTSGSWTPPTNYTERQDDGAITLDSRDNITSGSTGSISATQVVTDFMKAFLGVLAADAGGGTPANDASPAWFPGFMTGNAFPGFMLPAFQPINPAALPYDTGASGVVYLQSLAGTVGPAGAIVNQGNRALAGSVAPAGALTKQVGRTVAGSLTPAGALVKSVLKTLTGSITPSGALATALVRLLSVAGSITSSGALVKQVNKPLTAGLTSSGSLTKQDQKRLTGTITPSGVVVNIKTILLSLAGAITPAGVLAKQAGKSLTGAVSSVGALVRQTAKRPTGTIASSGAAAVTRVILRTFTGAITPAGVVAKRVGKSLTGSVNPTGSLLKLLSRTLGGGITPTGSSSQTVGIPVTPGTAHAATGTAPSAQSAVAGKPTAGPGSMNTPTATGG